MKTEKNIPKLHSGRMELAVAALIGYRKHVIVPNVSWGLNLNHECDLLILDDNNRFTEVEIKISLSDLKADFNKKHGHKSKIISRLIYAVPTFLVEKTKELVPNNCGIIEVFYNEYLGCYQAKWIRQCKHDKTKETPTQSVINNFYRLGCMRIWSLKSHNNK